MIKINRRTFATRAGVSLAGAMLLSQMPGVLRAAIPGNDPGMPVGFQSFAIRDKIEKDFPGALKTMAAMGYQSVEMCSPKAYASMGFGGLVNLKPAEIKRIINDAGLSCPSCHFGFGELNVNDQLEDRIEFAQQLGLTQMICSTFWLPEKSTLKDYQLAAEKLNKAAEKIKQAGMQAGFHNHEMEFAQLEGQLIYDVLMNSFDPALVKMQFQTEVIKLGYKAADYFVKYPGRFISAHLSDWTADKKQVPIGNGIIDWPGFFKAAKTGGVQNVFVEMEFDQMKGSIPFIKKL